MSENILRLIPSDPLYVPSAAAQDQAYNLFVSLLQAGEVQIIVTENVLFIDGGSNVAGIQCPSCGALFPMEWWIQVMDRASNHTRFANLSVIVPCCEVRASLNDLCYAGPAGFARFLLEARSPGSDLTEEHLSLFEPLLGCRVRKIWAHY